MCDNRMQNTKDSHMQKIVKTHMKLCETHMRKIVKSREIVCMK
jgi:hypothetical protein